MLTRLELAEPRTRLLDPDDIPGGKWGIVAAGTVAVIVVLLIDLHGPRPGLRPLTGAVAGADRDL